MKKKGILFALFGGIAAVVVAVVLVWNKPHKTVENEPGLRITAEVLAKAFEENEQNANDTYLNKILEVGGTISEVTKNQDGRTVLLLGVEDPLSGVQCTMKDDKATYESGQRVTVKGFCNGYTTVVLLNDCVGIKN
jgi:hypothetical protein